MTPFIWMLTWLPQVLSAMSELPMPVNVSLTSIQFIHLLTWQPGPGTPRDAHYCVSVHAGRGSSWKPVPGCERVESPLVCNLTKVFPDPRNIYYSKVTAVLGGQYSPPFVHEGFKPINGTQLYLPLLTVSPCDRALCVGLQPPWEHHRQIYESLQYRLRVKKNNDRDQFFLSTQSLKKVVLEDLAPGRQYCVSVCFFDSRALRSCSDYSQPQCAFTASIHTADAVISTVICMLVVSGLVYLALMYWTGFICLKEPLPSVLTSIQHAEGTPVAALRDKALFSLIHIEPTAPSTGEKVNNSLSEDDSDGETDMDSGVGSGRGGGYELRAPASPLSSSSLLFESPSLSSDSGVLLHSLQSLHTVFLPPELFTADLEHTHSPLRPLAALRLQPGASSSSDSCSMAACAASHSAFLPNGDQHALWGPESKCHHIDTLDTFIVEERIEPKEEEEEEEEGPSEDVNLLSLTLGVHEEEEEEEEDKPNLEKPERELMSPFDSEKSQYRATPLVPSRTRDAGEVAMETLTPYVEEEEDEEDECLGYMRR
ncbi:uncharacterized protein ACJ7VT_014960 isoform 2-T2 [Polymixia lowei]